MKTFTLVLIHAAKEEEEKKRSSACTVELKLMNRVVVLTI